jgi:hypothetical protein
VEVDLIEEDHPPLMIIEDMTHTEDADLTLVLTADLPIEGHILAHHLEDILTGIQEDLAAVQHLHQEKKQEDPIIEHHHLIHAVEEAGIVLHQDKRKITMEITRKKRIERIIEESNPFHITISRNIPIFTEFKYFNPNTVYFVVFLCC